MTLIFINILFHSNYMQCHLATKPQNGLKFWTTTGVVGVHSGQSVNKINRGRSKLLNDLTCLLNNAQYHLEMADYGKEGGSGASTGVGTLRSGML